MATEPPSYDSMPAMTVSSVDFPQPDGPTILTNLPSSTARLISCRTTNSSPEPGTGNLFVNLSMVMADATLTSCLTGCPGITGAIAATGEAARAIEGSNFISDRPLKRQVAV